VANAAQEAAGASDELSNGGNVSEEEATQVVGNKSQEETKHFVGIKSQEEATEVMGHACGSDLLLEQLNSRPMY